MTKHAERYYYLDNDTRTVFHGFELVEDRPDLIFLGSSFNPNIKMAVASFTKGHDHDFGYKIKPLP